LNLLSIHPKLQEMNLLPDRKLSFETDIPELSDMIISFISNIAKQKTNYKISLYNGSHIVTPTSFQAYKYDDFVCSLLNGVYSVVPTIDHLIVIRDISNDYIYQYPFIQNITISLQTKINKIIALIKEGITILNTISIIAPICYSTFDKTVRFYKLAERLEGLSIPENNTNIIKFDVPLTISCIVKYIKIVPNVKEFTIYLHDPSELEIISKMKCTFKILVPLDILLKELPDYENCKYFLLN
jgi:hypothetical protein